MANEEAPDGGHSVPEVFDRIAERARQVGAHDDTPTGDVAPDERITVEMVSDDGSITVTLADGRVTGLRFDEATARRRISTVTDDLAALINAALAAHEKSALAELQAAPTDFGALLTSLGELQSELHSAYITDVRRLDD